MFGIFKGEAMTSSRTTRRIVGVVDVETVAAQETRGCYSANGELSKPLATAALQMCRRGLAMQFIGDSRVLIDCLLGRARAESEGLQRPVRQAHSMMRQLVKRFAVRNPRGRVLAQQVGRADNSAADAAANLALDTGSFRQVYCEEMVTAKKWCDFFVTRWRALVSATRWGYSFPSTARAEQIPEKHPLECVGGGAYGATRFSRNAERSCDGVPNLG